MDIGKLRTDEDAEIHGVWRSLGDAEFKVARLGNNRYQQYLAKKLPEVSDEPTKRDHLVIDAMARFILVDWKNVQLDGEELPYSYENALKVLEIKDFRTTIQMYSTQDEEYRTETLKKKQSESSQS